MIVYHFAWDLSAYQLIGVDVTNELGWRIFARTIAGTFLVLVGINLVLALRNGFRPRPYVRRLAIILAAALLVSLGTWWLDPGTFVFFGILHLIFVASILALPFIHAPLWLILAAAIVFLAGPHLLASPVLRFARLVLARAVDRPAADASTTSRSSRGSASSSSGVAAGRLILANPGMPLWHWPAAGRLSRGLAFAGRWSLRDLPDPPADPDRRADAGGAAPRRRARPRSAARCSTSSRRAAPRSATTAALCEAYAACILTELDRHENILSDAAKHALSDADRALVARDYVEDCRRQIPAGAFPRRRDLIAYGFSAPVAVT